MKKYAPNLLVIVSTVCNIIAVCTAIFVKPILKEELYIGYIATGLPLVLSILILLVILMLFRKQISAYQRNMLMVSYGITAIVGLKWVFTMLVTANGVPSISFI